MSYKAKQVDTDKALEYIRDSRRYQEQAEVLELEKIKQFYAGIRKGLDIAEEIFTCANFESKKGTYSEGVQDTIYSLAKELDIPSEDIRESGKFVDDMCAEFAKRIRDNIAEEEKDCE